MPGSPFLPMLPSAPPPFAEFPAASCYIWSTVNSLTAPEALHVLSSPARLLSSRPCQSWLSLPHCHLFPDLNANVPDPFRSGCARVSAFCVNLSGVYLLSRCSLTRPPNVISRALSYPPILPLPRRVLNAPPSSKLRPAPGPLHISSP